jgi:Tfp pilus assembly protein PilF
LVLVFIVPLLVLAAVEAGLRVAGFGVSSGFFKRLPDKNLYVANRDFASRFFAFRTTPEQLPIAFPIAKPPQTCRVFVLGGSAALGWPAPSYSFARVLEVMLRESFPTLRIEVVNTAMTAVNSHVVLPVARDCAERQPDAFVVFMGNNEVVGPFGAGTVFGGFSPHLGLIRAALWVRTLRIGQLVAKIVGGIAGARDHDWEGMAMFTGQEVGYDDPRLSKVRDHFRRNLADICAVAAASGADVVLSTVPVNVHDCAPFASLHRDGIEASALERWQAAYAELLEATERGDDAAAIAAGLTAAEIDSTYADLQFRLATLLERTGAFEAAARRYELAKERDALRFRADDATNRIIREVGATAGERVLLADAVGVFAADPRSRLGLPGNELFHEHVHLNYEGNYLIARAVFERLAPALRRRFGLPEPADAVPPSAQRCADLLALTAWNRYIIATNVLTLTTRAPFTNQLDYAEQTDRRRLRVRELSARMTEAVIDSAAATYEQALAAAPGDPVLHGNFGMVELLRGRTAEAAAEWRRTLAAVPTHTKIRNNLAMALAELGATAEALEQLQISLQFDREAPTTHLLLATVHRQRGEIDLAKREYRRVLELRPEQTEALVELGTILEGEGELDQAAALYRRAVAATPPSGAAHFALGRLAEKKGDLAAAVDAYLAGLRLEPRETEIRRHAIELLDRLGRRDEARIQRELMN